MVLEGQSKGRLIEGLCRGNNQVLEEFVVIADAWVVVDTRIRSCQESV